MPPHTGRSYHEVAADLRAKIRDGTYPAGSRLPTRRQLAEQYDVGTTSVDTAMMLLRAEGLVRGHPGKGVYVAESPIRNGGDV